MNYRSELKYILTDNEFNLINHNLKAIMKYDNNTLSGIYTISSIYFDNYYKTSYNQVLNGISIRWKYRIRFYNYNSEYIRLEKKSKVNGLTNKKSVLITKKVLENILSNKMDISKSNEPLLNEFIVKCKTELLRPIILIEYDRIPYIYKIGNVRITLDYNIRYINKFNNLFSKEKKVYYLKDKILEVKYDELIPDFIRLKLNLNNLERISYSKFNNCINDLNRRF